MDLPGSPVGIGLVARTADLVAPDLLNKIIVSIDGDDARWARIVEVEAYTRDDPASHSFGGPSNRNLVMFGPPGCLYVYFSYGMHWCANVVTGPSGSGEAVLLRAGEPLGGLAGMSTARGGVPARELCRGPARLTRALGISGTDNGAGLLGPTQPGRPPNPGRSVLIVDDGMAPPAAPVRGPRVGITRAADVTWRWWVPGSKWVSVYRPGVARRVANGAQGPGGAQ